MSYFCAIFSFGDTVDFVLNIRSVLDHRIINLLLYGWDLTNLRFLSFLPAFWLSHVDFSESGQTIDPFSGRT